MLNSRFVPIYFDLGRGSPAADKAARVFVVNAKKNLGGAAVSTPPVLLMTAAGEVVGEISNYATEEQMLSGLRKVLKDHPEYAKPSANEAQLSRLQRANIEHFVGNDVAAVALLAPGERTSEEILFLAQIARRTGDAAKARQLLKSLAGEQVAEVALEMALLSWLDGDYEAMMQPLAMYPGDGARKAEADYYLGMAQYHQGDSKAARTTWKKLVKANGDNRWSYRADWAYSQTSDKGKAKQRRMFTTTGSKSLLGRHGYMGRQNPDLKKR